MYAAAAMFLHLRAPGVYQPLEETRVYALCAQTLVA